jgi:hypothetical protein
MWRTQFWQRMEEAFGSSAATFAQDRVLTRLADRTVNEALAQGEDARDVWNAVVAEMQLPLRLR